MSNHDPLPKAVYAWIDLEFTSADPDTAAILEFAGRVTDANLTQLGSSFNVVVRPDSLDVQSLDANVR
jgi:oligoribonuclease (3'-5' exoribonuclease)